MVISFLTRGLVLALGYAYPAYECYKTVEKNRPEIEQLRFWCQYWILVAVLTIFERAGEAFISWLPMYSEAKLIFFIYLWYPRTRGSIHIYESLVRPFVSKHEREIDQSLVELRVRAGDMVVLFCKKAAGYGQSRIFEILQYIAAQSASSSPSSVQVCCLIFLDFHVNRQQQQRPPHIPHFVTNQQNQPLDLSPQLSFINDKAPEMSAPPYPNAAAITNPNPHHGATSPSGSESAMLSEVVKSNSTGEKVEADQEVLMEGVVEVKHSRFRVRHSAG